MMSAMTCKIVADLVAARPPSMSIIRGESRAGPNAVVFLPSGVVHTRAEIRGLGYGDHVGTRGVAPARHAAGAGRRRSRGARDRLRRYRYEPALCLQAGRASRRNAVPR